MVLAMIGVLAGIAAMGWRGLLQREEARSSLVSLRHAFSHAGTAAAARGETLVLVWEQGELRLQDPAGTTVRAWDFPDDTPTSLTPGDLTGFTPPGRVDDLGGLPDPLTVTVNDRTATIEVSLIGGTEVTW